MMGVALLGARAVAVFGLHFDKALMLLQSVRPQISPSFRSGDCNSSLASGISRFTVFYRGALYEVVKMNAVIAAVGIMLVLSLSRVHVVIALFVGAVVGCLVGG